MRRFFPHLMLAGLGLLLGVGIALSLVGLRSDESHGGRPNEKQLQSAVDGLGGNSHSSVKACQARKLEDSELGDEALWALVDNESYSLSKDEKALLAEGGDLWVELKTCEENK